MNDYMSDKEALDILGGKKQKNMDSWCKAISVAAKRLNECQWHDYNPETFDKDCRIAFGSSVILGIRYSDGSKGSVGGFVNYDMQKGYFLCIDVKERSYLTDNAVIEKWMKYPDYK